MEISVDASGVIMQYGQNLGARDGCTIETVDDALLEQLHQDGIKTLQPDGTITVAPAPIDRAAHAALMERKWQASQDKKLIAQAMKPGATITSAHFAALARQAGAI